MTDEKFEIICLETTTSTNDEALRLSQGLSGRKVVVRALRQTAGRGRRGRSWQSLEGNLFFSILREFPLYDLGRLVMAASLALLQTIKQYNASTKVQLKWPNDVLLDGAKVSGMLLEKGEGDYMVIGIGVNIRQNPESDDMLYPTTSLQKVGITTTADEFLQNYLLLFENNILKKASELRQQWLKNAKGVGQKVSVRQENTVQTGIFEGIDENADLILRIGGQRRKILAGDMFYLGDENG